MAVPRRLIGFLAGFVVLALLGSLAYLRISSASAEETGEEGSGSSPVTAASSSFATDVAIAVEGAEVVLDTLILSVSASGQAEAWRTAPVTAEVGGRVDAVPVRESQRVGAGQVVLVLDPVDKQLALDEAEAALREANAAYQQRVALDANLSPEIREERARVSRVTSGVDRAEIQVKRARLELERTRTRAPFAGRVASIKVAPGQLVSQGTELMTVVDLDPIKVQVQVLEGELAHLERGGSAQIRFSAFPDEVFSGQIETINPLVEEQTRMARVTVLVPNPTGRVLPGMYARVELEAQRIPDRILVPRSAILERDRRTMLFVHEDGRAKWRYVTTGLQNEHLVEIVENPETEMVEPGEVVLTGGHFTLTHDATVRLVEDYRQAETGRPQ